MGNQISYNITYEVFWTGSVKYNNDQPVNSKWISPTNESIILSIMGNHISYNITYESFWIGSANTIMTNQLTVDGYL